MHHRIHHHIKISIILVVILAIFANLLMWGAELVFAQKIGIGVKIAGIDLGGKTQRQAQEILKQEFWEISQSGAELLLDKEKLNPTLDQIGVIFNFENSVKQALRYGKGGDFFIRFWQISKMLFGKQNFKANARVDKAKLFAYLEYIGGETIQHSQNATLNYSDIETTGYFEIIPEKDGKTIDEEILSSSLIENINDAENLKVHQFKNLKLKIKNSKASIRSKDLLEVQNRANQLIAKAFVFHFENKEFTAENQEIAKWLEFVEINKEIEIELDELAIDEYLNTIAKRIDIAVVNKVVEVAGGQKTTKREGKAGRQLNRAHAIEIIINNFFSGSRDITIQTQVVEPAEKIVYPDSPPVGGLYPGKYIEINISAKQKLYLWEGDKLIGGPYSISSGKAGYYTPTGTYRITSKTRMAWSATYGLYMPYWMQFKPAYGIHELPEWPGGYKEGANHLGIRVSHGCVRLGVGPAAYAYGWAPIGTPVYIHY